MKRSIFPIPGLLISTLRYIALLSKHAGVDYVCLVYQEHLVVEL